MPREKARTTEFVVYRRAAPFTTIEIAAFSASFVWYMRSSSYAITDARVVQKSHRSSNWRIVISQTAKGQGEQGTYDVHRGRIVQTRGECIHDKDRWICYKRVEERR
jgi:hypothetical protein